MKSFVPLFFGFSIMSFSLNALPSTSIDCSAYNKFDQTKILHSSLSDLDILTLSYKDIVSKCKKSIAKDYFFMKAMTIKEDSSREALGHKIYRSYVGCFYYDPKSPSAKVATNPSWVWAKNPDNTSDDSSYLRLTGYYEENFFFVTDVRMNEAAIHRACVASIPKEKKLLNVEAFNYSFDIFSYKIGHDPNFKYSLAKKGPLSDLNIKKLIFFGDSLTDTGLLQKWTRLLPTGVYWNGHFSNGPVWIEYMAQALSYKLPYNNLSYGGLKTSQAAEHDLNNDPYDAIREFFRNKITGGLKEEVSSYINKSGVKASSAEHNLYGIWVGGNNYLEKVLSRTGYRAIINEMIRDENKPSFSFGDSPTALAYIQRTVQDIIDAMESLYNHGARHFAVAGLMDMSTTPLAAKDSVTMVFYYLSLKHNEFLKDALEKFRKSHADIKVLAYLDAAVILNEFLGHSKEFGLTNTTQACYTGSYVLGKAENGEICEKPNEFLFFDKVHPTTRAHCFVSYYVLLDFYKQNILNKAPIPLNDYISFCQGQS